VLSQTPDPSAFHHPAGMVPLGQTFWPVRVQQNSVQPSQHKAPQSQFDPEHEQIAA
jgi:hypothetical protein